MNARLVSLLFLRSISLSGCGGGAGSFVFTSTPEPPTTMSVERVVVGRLHLGLETPGATFRLESLNGDVLGSGSTNLNGLVFFREIQIPKNFRAVATLPGSDVEFSAQIRDFSQNNKQARISLLTTLVDRYAQAHPEQGIEEAERRIKTLMNIPPGVDISIGPEGINPFFSDLALWRAAGQNGGWEAFSADLLSLAELLNQDTDSGPGHVFLLSLDQLDRPVWGLEPALQEVAEQTRVRLATRLGIEEATGEQLLRHYQPNITLLEGPQTLGGQFLLGIGTGVANNLLSDGVQGAVGWLANQMGLNYGTSGQLQEIEAELSSLISLVESFEETQVSEDLTNDFNSLQSFFSQVRSTSNQLSQQASITEITNTPVSFTSTDPLTTLLNALNSQTYTSALIDANTNLLGQTEFLMLYQQTYLNMKLGLDTPANMQGMPWRSNEVLNVVTSMFGHFSKLQVETLNLLSEQTHTYPINPSQSIPALRNGTLATTLSNLKKQRQQMALFASVPDVIVDLENGTMWWATMAYPDTFANAKDAAESFSCQQVFPDGSTRTYDDWRLPSVDDCTMLQLRGMYNPSPGDPTYTGSDSSHTLGGVPVNSKGSYPDTGQSTAGLPRLGFYQVRQALNASMNDNGQNGDMWVQDASSDGTEIVLQDDVEFRLNHASENLHTENSSKDVNVYLLCRTFGPVNLSGLQFGYFDGSPLTAGEIAQWGVPTSITITSVEAGPSSISFPANSAQGGMTINSIDLPKNSLEIQAEITYNINIGGPYTVGFGRTHSESKSSYNYSATVSTSKNAQGNPNYLAQLVDWTVDNHSALYILNLPYTRGIAIPYQATEVTLKASLLGARVRQLEALFGHNRESRSA